MRQLEKPTKLLSFSELESKHGITFKRRHLYDLEDARRLPKRVQLGLHHVGWVQSEIEEWLAQKLANRKL